jgi:hypothetical protein
VTRAHEAAAVDALKALRAETRELDIVPEAWNAGENQPARGRGTMTQDRAEAEAIARPLSVVTRPTMRSARDVKPLSVGPCAPRPLPIRRTRMPSPMDRARSPVRQ